MADKIMGHVVFLDRDGVINKDSSDYIKTVSEFEFIPKSPEAIALLCKHDFKIIIITNQSIIGRKTADPSTLNAIFKKMTDGVKKAGGHITDIFFCPHLPKENCLCRKPSPGLIQQAILKHRIDLSKTIMVGDSVKDIECALNAGCKTTVLVKTGNGNTALPVLKSLNMPLDHVADDLYAAAQWIIQNIKHHNQA